MLRFDERINVTDIPAWDKTAEAFGKDRVLMFDLETTGLSPQSSFIYIIGVNYWKDGSWHILQLFNDDGRSEPEMLRTFMDLCKEKTTLFHFNGDTFDIPFVKNRMEKIRKQLGISIPDHMSSLTSRDYLKEIRVFKYALGLPNVKQKTVERYLGIQREDQYDGGQLIGVYLNYLSSGYQRNRDLVLLHNRDDMEGMFHLARMNALTMLSDGDFVLGDMSTEQRGDVLYLILPVKLSLPLPCPLVTTGCGATLRGEGYEAVLRLPLVNIEAVSTITNEKAAGFYLPNFGYEGVITYRNPSEKKASMIAADNTLLGDHDRLHSYAACAVGRLMKQNIRKKS